MQLIKETKIITDKRLLKMLKKRFEIEFEVKEFGFEEFELKEGNMTYHIVRCKEEINGGSVVD